jgi:predicted phage tail protein
VSWGSVSTATSYTLQESSNGGSSWSTAYTGSGTSKALSGKGNGTYTYRVEACNAGGCGAWSATHAIKVALIPVVSGLPLTLSVTGPDFKPVVHVSWSAVPAATEYKLEMRKATTQEVTVVSDGSSLTWSMLMYYSGELDFRLQACNSTGCSGWSTYQHVILNSGNTGGGPLLQQAQGGDTE